MYMCTECALKIFKSSLRKRVKKSVFFNWKKRILKTFKIRFWCTFKWVQKWSLTIKTFAPAYKKNFLAHTQHFAKKLEIKAKIKKIRIFFIFIYNFLLRNLNEPCNWMDFFDNHDMWHFFSATSLFLAFIGLLTIDDDLLFEPRDQIRVFWTPAPGGRVFGLITNYFLRPSVKFDGGLSCYHVIKLYHFKLRTGWSNF